MHASDLMIKFCPVSSYVHPVRGGEGGSSPVRQQCETYHGQVCGFKKQSVFVVTDFINTLFHTDTHKLDICLFGFTFIPLKRPKCPVISIVCALGCPLSITP